MACCQVDSADPPIADVAKVFGPTGPVPMLLRYTSVPLRCTTTPSSRMTDRSSELKADAAATLNELRNQVVVCLFDASPPYDTTVASSPSP